MKAMKVLIVGGGGREHALAWKIAQSPLCEKLFIAPGNPLMEKIGKCVDIPATDIVGLKAFAKQEEIDLTVVGPEAPLVAGIVDSFEKSGLKVFGPSKSAARLEGSKGFSKEIMKKYHIPTADFKRATTMEQAQDILSTLEAPLVVKADGLAEGKGAFVCMTKEEAEEALHIIFAEGRFGESGKLCVFEEFMEGEEASLFVLTDGNTILPLMPAQDHKRLLDHDEGPNTGGMGSYAPAPVMTTEMQERVLKEIVVPTVHAMNSEGAPYRGLLYVGLMLSERQARVVEYNCRFGDPETQPLMTLLKTDILPLFYQIACGKIEDEFQGLEWHEGSAIGVVLASNGYPGAYEKGFEIHGLNQPDPKVEVFGAGVKGTKEQPVTGGGRVLCVTARGEDLEEARARAYRAIEQVGFKDNVFRTDIGWRALGNPED